MKVKKTWGSNVNTCEYFPAPCTLAQKKMKNHWMQPRPKENEEPLGCVEGHIPETDHKRKWK
jgi:hypothetical protein